MARLFVTARTAGAAAFEALRPHALAHFAVLPVIVLDADAATEARLRATPGLHVQRSNFAKSYLRLLEIFDAQAASPIALAVSNLSISHGPGDFEPDEPLNVATRLAAAAGWVPVVAAGNDGGRGAGSLSRWAAAPWVIGVGAATADGGALLPLSSTGRAAEPDSGPDVVAHGETVVGLTPDHPLNHGTMVALVSRGKEGAGRWPGYRDTPLAGTSVATPRVVRICELLGLLLQTVLGLATLVLARLPARAALSDYLLAVEALAAQPGIDKPDGPVLHGLPQADAAPILALLMQMAVRGRLLRPETLPATPDVPRAVGLLRRPLRDMAVPVPGCGPHEAGAGFVSDAIADAWLARLTAADLLRVLYGAPVPIPTAPEPLLTPALRARLHAMRELTKLTDAPVL